MYRMHIYPFLMFEGKAGEALEFYLQLFPSARIDHMEVYGADGPGQKALSKTQSSRSPAKPSCAQTAS